MKQVLGANQAGHPRTDREQTDDVADLVRRAAKRERTAWDALVDRYVALVWAQARAYGLSENDCLDVVQTTWLRLLEHIDRITDPSRVGGWLATTARRESLQILAKERRLLPVADFDAFDAADRCVGGPDERLLAEERAMEIRHAVQALPPRWQALVSLLVSDPPKTYQEIGRDLSLPVGSIGPTRGRCMRRLRDLVEV